MDDTTAWNIEHHLGSLPSQRERIATAVLQGIWSQHNVSVASPSLKKLAANAALEQADKLIEELNKEE